MKEKNVFYLDESQEMLEAYKKAEDTFKYFWRELWWEYRRVVPALSFACVKVGFVEEQNSEKVVEHMWINSISFDGINVMGVLINEPNHLKELKNGDEVKINLEGVSDWLFCVNKVPYGGFTIQAMRANMDKKERKDHDKAWGIDFGEPDKISLAYEQDKHPENLIEHPMSKNMRQSLEQFLEQYPDEIKNQDEFGYTMLHREAVAGNRTCVEVLLANGADKNIKTNDGYTAYDFAKKLNWENLIDIL